MATNTDAPSFYDDVENLKKLCNFLQTSEGPRVREALLMEKRVTYLKGGSLNAIYLFTIHPLLGNDEESDVTDDIMVSMRPTRNNM